LGFGLLDKKIDKGVYIIAEMSANHAGDLGKALGIVRAAKEAGADCLKLQTYTADSLTIDCDEECFRVKDGLWDGYRLHDLYSKAAMPYKWQGTVKDECGKEDIDFLSTPFDEKGVDFLEGLGVEGYKIASFELVHLPLIRYVARKGKPMVVSCGMGSEGEIGEAVDVILSEGLSKEQVILLKCTSEYPASFSDMNLLTIPDMIGRFGCRVGFSDHSPGSGASVAAVALGATVIEKHLCRDRADDSVDGGFSMEPDGFAAMARDVRDAAAARGCVKYGPTEGEKASAAFRRSIFAVEDIKEGERLTEKNVRVIRPGYGAHPRLYGEVIGKRAAVDLKKGTPLTERAWRT